ADRFKDYDFPMESVLDGFDKPLPDEFRQKLREDVAAYRLALWNSDLTRHKDFTDAEKLSLLARTDAEGKRMQVSAYLSDLLKARGPLNDQVAGCDQAGLWTFRRTDIEAQAEKAGDNRADFVKLSASMRNAYWKGVNAAPESDRAADHFGFEGAYK